ncbi:MAG TPA: OmpA family protein [Gemmatimonadaceae bacterium]|jgi:outer membrane protein OmpA-like peptidoglycan-associated protein|nr:OmpA family protein [Gemmatimonadaceae bacterium]
MPAILLVITAGAAYAQRSINIPFDKGLVLTWVSSISNEPDWETRLEIVDSSAFSVTLRHSWSRGSRPGATRWRMEEFDLTHRIREVTRSFYVSLGNDRHDAYLASTFFMMPLPALRELEASGRANVSFFVPEISQLPFKGTLTRAGLEPVSVVFNDARVSLRGIRAKGVLRNAGARFPELRMSFLLVDDAAAPWIAELELVRPDGFRGYRQLARVSYRMDVAADLATRCRATVHDIHFATASAEIDPASSMTLATIAKALKDHRDWRITIVGHTDSIGASAANLELSRRRAEAARLALVSEHGVDPARVRSEGRGENQPIEDNGTLAGRARNRRVELLRDCR